MKKDEFILSGVKNLILVGNGFDIWQGLPTSYNNFKEYYQNNKVRIAKQLHIKPIILKDENGLDFEINYIELFYGFLKDKNISINNHDSTEILNAEFWSDFENNLFYLNDYYINLYFGKEKSDLRRMKRAIKKLRLLLTELFCQWIQSINVSEQKSEYNFKDCLFINFNYTSTLQKRFRVDKLVDYHIHGSAENKKSIVFGHNNNENNILISLRKTAGRLKGLAQIAMAQFMLNKHPDIQIEKLLSFHLDYGSICAGIKDIYCLGLSFGDADFEYFNTFNDAYPNAHWHISYHSPKDKTKILKVMQKIKNTNFELVKDIPAAIEPFKIKD